MEPAAGSGTGRYRHAKRRGRYYEHRAKALLEGRGYLVTRAAGSLGVFDLIAIGDRDVKAVQVKGGQRPRLRGPERRALVALRVAPGVSKELWLFPVGAHAPHVEVL